MLETAMARHTPARLVYANAACLSFGLAMMAWGIAPAVIERLVTRATPSVSTLAVGTGSFVLGLLFIGLHVLIRRRVRWALWVAFLVSLAIVTSWLIAAMLDYSQFSSAFLIVLACATTVPTWLSLQLTPEECWGNPSESNPDATQPRRAALSDSSVF